MAKQVHTTYNKATHSWGNVQAGKTKSPSAPSYSTKSAAQSAGRQQAKSLGAEHVIHKQNGKIGQRNSYGKDPFPPKG